MTTDVVEAGTGDVLVAFLHGVLDRGRSFETVAGLLEGECRTLRYDRRGYAGEPVGSYASVGDHAGDLVRLLAGRPAVVVGHSFGGMSALTAAARAPELVEALVLYETPVAWAPGWDDTVMLDVLGADDPAGAGLEALFDDRYEEPSPRSAHRRAQAAAFIAEESSVRRPERPFDLATIRCPVVYGWGGDEMVRAIPAYLATQLAELEVVHVPGASHHAHRTDPEAFADLVRRGITAARRARS